jgi:hypothetical protein
MLICFQASKDTEERLNALIHQHEKDVQQRETRWANDLRRTTQDRDEKQRQLQQMQEDLDKSREAHQRSEEQLRKAESTMAALRKQKAEADPKIRNSLEVTSVTSSEVRVLGEKLKSKTEEFQAQQRELSILRQEHTDLQNQILTSTESMQEIQAQLLEHQSTIKALREIEARLSVQQQEATSALDDAKKQVSTLQKEKRGLESKLEESRRNEKLSLKDAEAKFSADKQHWEKDIEKLRASNQESRRELQRIQEEASETLSRVTAAQKDELNGLKQQLETAEQALKESEAACRSIEDEKSRELEAHKEITAEKMKEKFDEEVRAYRKVMEQQKEEEVTQIRRRIVEDSRVTQATETSHASEGSLTLPPLFTVTSSQSAGPVSSRKTKKKVDRRNNLVMESRQSDDPSGTIDPSQLHLSRDGESPDESVSLRRRSDIQTPETRDMGHMSRYEDSAAAVPQTQGMVQVFRRVSAEIVPETQEIGQGLPSSGVVPETQDTGVGLYEFAEMLFSAPSPFVQRGQSGADKKVTEDRRLSTPIGSLRAAERSPLKENRAYDVEPGNRDDANMVSGIDSPLRSLANTRTRMAPPVSLPTLNQVSKAHVGPSEIVKSRRRTSSQRSESILIRDDSPDPLSRGTTGLSKVTYGHRVAVTPSPDGRPQNVPAFDAPDALAQKRKISASQTERRPTKRARDQTTSPPSSVPQRSSARPPSSHVERQTYGQVRSFSNSVGRGSNGHAAGARRTKSRLHTLCFLDPCYANRRRAGSRYDLRFSQELQ